MPEQLFYNTGISTYVWIITNKKKPERRGKVQLVNGMGFYEKMYERLKVDIPLYPGLINRVFVDTFK